MRFLIIALTSTIVFSGETVPITEPSYPEMISKIELMEQRIKDLTESIVIECNVGVDTLKNGESKNYNLSSKLFGFNNGHFRMQVKYGFFDVLDISIGEKAEILDHQNNSAYIGTLEEARNSNHISKLAATEMNGKKFVFPEAWDKEADSRVISKQNNDNIVYVFRKQEETVQVIKKVWVEKYNDEYVITKIVRYDDNQDVCGIIEYSDYTMRECKSTNGKVTILIPSSIKIYADQNTKFSFIVNKVKFAKNTPEVMDIPEDFTRKSLSDFK